MLDLIKGLPSAIMVGGKSFPINTDFRAWLRFGQILKLMQERQLEDSEAQEILDLFTEEIPTESFMGQLFDFYACRELTPARNNDASSVEVLSFEADGSYIYSAFIQAYNIDLTECKLHWHKFNALLKSLPNDTKLSEIMGFRAYKKDSSSIESQYARSRASWTLPLKGLSTTEELEMMIRDAEREENEQKQYWLDLTNKKGSE